MRSGHLRDHFPVAVAKRLSAVEADPRRSNQHEIGIPADIHRQFNVAAPTRFSVRYIWLGGEQDGFSCDGTATYYDAREGQPKRSPEWRLYYPSNMVTGAMREGDTLFLAKHRSGILYFIVAPVASTSERRLSWMFGAHPGPSQSLRWEVGSADLDLDFAVRFILDELGIEYEDPDAAALDALVGRFGTSFPTTEELSRHARNTLPDSPSSAAPDDTLLAWLDHEEALFRRIERRIIADRIERGFVGEDGADVDGFMSFSLGVQNRRKARMGLSLEHHVEAILDMRGLSFVRGAVTERGNRPDFLFPSAEAYQKAPGAGAACLAMLGAKSTCKDRWRQVLVEADKIPRKHLLTLEPGISEQQTSRMEASKLQLVVPRSIHATYTAHQRGWLWTLEQFIHDTERRQR